MEISHLENLNIKTLNTRMDVYDIPGQGFFKSKIIELLPRAKHIIVFLDSSDK
jgi:signal recognition particle receptor subunit beta